MTYQKFYVDNITCSRRFHISYDDENPKVAKTTAKCPYCEQVVFSAENHPQVELARQENLTKTAELSDIVVRDCQFKAK